jgi:hypothetical protein
MLSRPFILFITMFVTVALARAAVAQPTPPTPAQATTTPEDAPEPIALRLLSGTIIIGTIVSEDADAIVIDAGPLGTLTIKTAEVAGRLDPSVVEKVGTPAPPPASAPQTGPGIFAEPGKVKWVRTLDFQGSYNSAIYDQGPVPGLGLTGAQLGLAGDQYTVNTQLVLSRATSHYLGYFNASYALAVFKPQGTVTKMPKVSFGFSHRRENDDRYYYTAQYEWYKDEVRNIDTSHSAFVGVGFHAVRQPKLQIDVVPLIGALVEDKGTQFDGELLEGMGAVWQLNYAPNAMIAIEHRETFHAAFNDFDYRGLETYVGFRGMMGPKLGVTVGMTYTYDKALEQTFLESPALPGVRVFANKSRFVKLTTGVHVAF